MVFARSLCSDSSGGIVLGWCCWHYEYHILLLFGQSVTNRIADKIASRAAANYEPQATEMFFGAAVFQKCCRGVGEQPTFAKQIILQSVFPAAIAFFESY